MGVASVAAAPGVMPGPQGSWSAGKPEARLGYEGWRKEAMVVPRGLRGGSMAPPMCPGSRLLGERKGAHDDGLGQAPRGEVSPHVQGEPIGAPTGAGWGEQSEKGG